MMLGTVNTCFAPPFFRAQPAATGRNFTAPSLLPAYRACRGGACLVPLKSAKHCGSQPRNKCQQALVSSRRKPMIKGRLICLSPIPPLCPDSRCFSSKLPRRGPDPSQIGTLFFSLGLFIFNLLNNSEKLKVRLLIASIIGRTRLSRQECSRFRGTGVRIDWYAAWGTEGSRV